MRYSDAGVEMRAWIQPVCSGEASLLSKLSVGFGFDQLR